MTTHDRGDNRRQIAYWNAAQGEKWARFQHALDSMLAQASVTLLDWARPLPGDRVLDVGCGAGALTLDLLEVVGLGGTVTGVDVSVPLLQVARRRIAAKNAAFLEADAQSYCFVPAEIDFIGSRFGVMFFEQPETAFANLRTALRPGGRLAFVAWAALDKNPWFSLPRAAAIDRLGPPEPASPRAPGPLAFSEIDYVTSILTRVGYDEIRAEERAVTLIFEGSCEDAVRLATNVGPATRIVDRYNGTTEDVAAIGAAINGAFRTFDAGDGTIRVPATLNLFRARQPVAPARC